MTNDDMILEARLDAEAECRDQDARVRADREAADRYCGFCQRPLHRGGRRVGCLLHAGDLRARVERVMNALSAVDEVTDNDLPMHARWLAWILSSSKVAAPATQVASTSTSFRIDDITVVSDVPWDAVKRFSAEELAAVSYEALLGRWPW